MLIMRRAWSEILILVRWQRHLHVSKQLGSLIPDWPPADAVVWTQEGQNAVVEESVSGISGKSCREISKWIQAWAPGALAASVPGQEGNVEMNLKTAVTRLNFWADDCDVMAGAKRSDQLGKLRHSALELFAAIRFAFRQKGGSS